MREFLIKNGIHHEMTTLDMPQQNSVAERYNRTLMESIRVVKITAGIPDDLWAELAASATYLHNRLPTRANKESASPFELWHGHKPDISNLRVIWADAYMHIRKGKRSKLALRSKKLKMIGYHDEKKAYRLWDPTNRRIEISCDVIFDESIILKSPTIVNPEDQEYVIEAIIRECKIDEKRQYLVKWLGYDDDDNTWEPIKQLIDTEALQIWQDCMSEANLIELTDDPMTYKEAISLPDTKLWEEAINQELKSLKNNDT